MKHFLLLLLSILCLAAHPIEKMSVGELNYEQGAFLLKVNVLEEDLQPVLRRNGLHPEVSFRNYMHIPFDDQILPSIEAYVKANLELKVNNTPLVPKFKRIDWGSKDKYSDHAAIAIEVAFPSENIKKGQILKVTNTLLSSVYGQTNLLHVRLFNYQNTWIFKKGNETKEIKWP